jgi:hypothetical protein
VAAPIIVLGKVLNVENVGGSARSPGDPRIRTQLTRIKIDVEQIVKGSIRSNAIEFYFFTYASDNRVDLGVPRYVPEIGQRQIYFLEPWQKTYRSIGDVTNYNLPMPSGTRPKDFCRGKDPGCCMAEMLLVPGRGVEVDWFVRDLGPSSAYAAGIFCSPRRVQELLVKLTSNPDNRIADSAMDVMPMLEQWWPELKAGAR